MVMNPPMRTKFSSRRLYPRRRTYVTELLAALTISAVLLGIAYIPLVVENINVVLRVQGVAAHR